MLFFSTPACVDTASIPSLEQEAHAFAFDPKKPRWALGCPLMPIRFHLKMQLEDQSDVLEVTLKDQHAVRPEVELAIWLAHAGVGFAVLMLD